MIEGVPEMREAYRDEKVAKSYIENRFRRPPGALLHQRQLGVLRKVIGEMAPKRVLEIAPGPARLTMEVAALLKGGGVAIDASRQMLAEAAPRIKAAGSHSWVLAQGDAFCLPLAGPFDMVYTFRLIRHFDRAERVKLYKEIARVLRPGGVLVFDAINEEESPERGGASSELQHYDARLNPTVLREELAEAGFTVSELTGVQHRYALQYKVDVLLSPRSLPLSRLAIELIDRAPGGKPLEWVVTCRRG